MLAVHIGLYWDNQKKFPSAIIEQNILNWNLLLGWQA